LDTPSYMGLSDTGKLINLRASLIMSITAA